MGAWWVLGVSVLERGGFSGSACWSLVGFRGRCAGAWWVLGVGVLERGGFSGSVFVVGIV